MNKRIPKKIYEQILEHTIISAVDAIIYHEGHVLLALRNQQPCKGQWWFPGGRQYKGETGEEAIIRKIRQELGLQVKVRKQVGVYDVMFGETAFENVKTGIHYVARVYLVTPRNNVQKIKLDATHDTLRWVGKIEEDLHEYVKTALQESGVFKEK